QGRQARRVSALPFILIANPGNRRATAFVDALARGGWPVPIVLSHRELIADPSALAALPDEPCLLRFDSGGENPEAGLALLELGAEVLGDDGPCERILSAELARSPVQLGQIVAPRQYHAGFLRFRERLEQVIAERSHWRVLNPIDDIRALF